MDNNDRGFGLTRGQYYKYSNDLKIESDWGFEVSPVAGTLSIDFSLSDKAQDMVREHFGVSSVPTGEERNIYLQARYAPENGDVTTLLYGSELQETFEPDKDLANFIRYSIHEYADRELGTSPTKLLDEATTEYLRSEGYEHPEDTGIDTGEDLKPPIGSDLGYPENVQDCTVRSERPEEAHGIAGYLQMRAKTGDDARRQANRGVLPKSFGDER